MTVIPDVRLAWRCSAIAVAATAILTASAPAQEATGWLRWRGPLQSGVSLEVGLPDAIDVADARWTYDKRGRGTPVIANGRVYGLAYDGEDTDLQEILYCLDETDGSVIWERRFSDFLSDVIYDRYAIGAPTVDAETGYIYWLTTPGLLCCFTPDGELRWQEPLIEKFGRLTYPNGRTQVPLIDDDLVILHTMTSTWGPLGPARDRFLAFDKITGDNVWISTPGGPPKDSPFSHPVFEWRDGKRLLYAGTAGGNMVCVNVRTGEPVWRYQMSIGGVCASPLLYGDALIAVHGKENIDLATHGRMISLKLGAYPGEGDDRPLVLDRSAENWRNNDLTSFTSSPVLHGNRIYNTIFTGELVCVDADSGETKWMERLASDQIHASPVYADGKLYVPMNNGSFHVVRAGDDAAEVLSSTELEGACLGAPAIWNGKIYVHTTERLYCFGNDSGSWSGEAMADIAPAPGEAVALQILPAEVLVRSGEPVEFRARAVDANGVIVRDDVIGLDWTNNPLGLNFSDDGMHVNTDGANPGAGVMTANVGGLTGSVRFRIVYPRAFTEDFETVALTVPDAADASVKWGRPPGFWISGFPKWDIREVDGSKVLAKTISNRIFMRTLGFVGDPDASNYTVQVDVMSDGNRRTMSDAGVINQRYLIAIRANQRTLEISSNFERIQHEIPFRTRPSVWYTLKSRVDLAADGSATIRAKAWPRDEDEPAEWMVEFVHRDGHTHGAPGIYGFSPQSRFRVYLDNYTVTPND